MTDEQVDWIIDVAACPIFAVGAAMAAGNALKSPSALPGVFWVMVAIFLVWETWGAWRDIQRRLGSTSWRRRVPRSVGRASSADPRRT